MSRSRSSWKSKCSVGRGCGCCGDAGLPRRRREHAWAKADGGRQAKTETAKDDPDVFRRGHRK